MNTHQKISFRNLGMPSYASGILDALNMGLQRFSNQYAIAGEVANSIWLKSFEASDYNNIKSEIRIIVELNDRHQFRHLISYLTSQNELTNSRVFWQEKFHPNTIEYLPEPFMVNFHPYYLEDSNEEYNCLPILDTEVFSVEIERTYTYKFISFERAIIENIYSWNFEDDFEYSLTKVSSLIHLIYSFFEYNWDDRTSEPFIYYQQKLDNSLTPRNRSIKDFFWELDGMYWIGERIVEQISPYEFIAEEITSNLDQFLEDKFECLNNQSVISFRTGTTSYCALTWGELRKALTYLKMGIRNELA